MKNLFILFLAFVSFRQVMAQEDATKFKPVNLAVIAEVNQVNNYITFPTDIGNLAPLLFEANVVPNLFIRKSKNARLMGVLTPQIILRMYQEESSPVRTPSYIPQVTIYYALEANPIKSQHTLFGRIAHHSNGQEGDFYLPDSNINLISGNFSTNFAQAGLIFNRQNKTFNAAQFFSTSLEVHPPGWSLDEMDGKYSMVRWHNALSIYKIPLHQKQEMQKTPSISMKAEAMWMFGKVNDWSAMETDRLNLNFTFFYHPSFLEDIGLFVEFYSGVDYYNIYFNEKVEAFDLVL
ncbi:MAG: phospholipase A [Bacteroidales bacterium]|nr:phospholipase A [Bacteroidales bacterium]